jgi:hypothetical protein
MLQASSWGKVTAFAELMTLVDVDRGGDNFWIDQGEPHDDALAVGEAVAALAHCDIVIPPGWNALADWPDDDGLVMPAVTRAVEQFHLRPPLRRAAGIVNLIVGTAILGREPAWDAEPSKVRMVERGGMPAWFIVRRVTDELGQTFDLEVDGRHPRTRRPLRGAYRRYEFSSNPAGDILARLDYQIWVAGLRLLADRLNGKLVDHRLVPCEREAAPWIGRDSGGVRLVDRKSAKNFAAAC